MLLKNTKRQKMMPLTQNWMKLFRTLCLIWNSSNTNIWHDNISLKNEKLMAFYISLLINRETLKDQVILVLNTNSKDNRQAATLSNMLQKYEQHNN